MDLSWRANNAGYKNVLCPTAKCYHICGASTGAVRYNAFKSQQSGRNSILLPLKNEPLLMLVLNFIPLALGYLLKCYKFHKQGFGEAWDKGMHEAFALLKSGQAGQAAFPPEGSAQLHPDGAVDDLEHGAVPVVSAGGRKV